MIFDITFLWVDMFNLTVITIFFFLVFAGIAVWLLQGFLKQLKQRNIDRASISTVLLEVKLPQSNEIEINAAEQFFSSISTFAGGLSFPQSLFRSVGAISFELVAMPESIRFIVCAPVSIRDLVEKQIHGSYPSAEITEVSEYNIFKEDGVVSFGQFQLGAEQYKPIKTYEDLSVDPLSNLTSALSRLVEGEGAVIQMVLSPTSSKWRKQGKSWVSNLKDPGDDEKKKKKSIPEDILTAVEKKLPKAAFGVDLRFVVSGNSKPRAGEHLENIAKVFEVFNNQGINHFKRSKLNSKKKKQLRKDFIYRVPRGQMVLNTEEVASVYHFPNKNIQTPHISWLLAKRAPAAKEVPSQGGVWLGKSIYRGVSKDVCILPEDRRRHMYIVGKTGAGKSYFLQNMIYQDILDGKGIAFLDPHGDAVEWLLERIPPERAEDVIYFNPADIQRPVGFNIIEFIDEQDKHRIVNSFIGLMYKMFDPNRQGIVGPRFERAVRNAMLTVMEEQGNTLIEVMRILTDPKFVKQKMPMIKDEMVKRYWTDEIAQTSDFHKSEVLGYIVSKFDRFVTNKLMRNIIGQSKSTINLRKIMDDGKILLVNLSKGRVGEENSQFLGLILVPKILSAAMSRADVHEENRKDFYLYVDEFQNFATEEFAQILSEARKYRLNLIVANQYISQIDEKIREAVFGNVGTTVSFKVGVNDSQYLQNEYAPVFDQNDLINLENLNAYIKMLVNGEYPPPFSMYTHIKGSPYGIPTSNVEVANRIIELSRLRYGKDTSLVDQEIAKRAFLGEDEEESPEGMGMGGGFDNFNLPPMPKLPPMPSMPSLPPSFGPPPSPPVGGNSPLGGNQPTPQQPPAQPPQPPPGPRMRG